MLETLSLPFRERPPRVSVLRLTGIIAANGARGTLAHAGLAPVIERAFRRGKPQAVALAINSPGGSPVQSALIGSHIRRLADELEMPVHAFVEDVAASGGYWLAAAADEIWVDHSSITGSIGVISAGFGFHELLARSGIERRVHTAGEDKSILDPFRPERARDVTRLKELQARIHDSFKTHVRARRGDRLDGSRDLFTGEIFVGEEAVEARFRVFAQRRPFMARLIPGVLDEAIGAVEDRAAWARFGL